MATTPSRRGQASPCQTVRHSKSPATFMAKGALPPGVGERAGRLSLLRGLAVEMLFGFVGLGRMNHVVAMLRRAIEGVELQRLRARVDQVVTGAGRNDDAGLSLGGARLPVDDDLSFALFDAEELVVAFFAVQQQVADFQEVGLRGQLVDRIAAVQQLAFVTVNKGDGRFAGCGRGEAGVKGEGAGAAVQLADIDDIRAGRAGKDGELYSLVLVGQGRRAGGFRLFSHLGPLFFLGPARGGGRPELVMGDHLVCCSASSKRPRLSSRPRAQRVRAISGEVEPPQTDRFLVEREWTRLQHECRLIRQLGDGLGAILDERHGPQQPFLVVRLQNTAARQVGVERQFGQAVVIRQPQPVGVDVGQFVEVQAGGRFVDARQVEPGEGLFVAEQLVVAVRPAQPGQIVAHGFGQIAHVGVFVHRLRAVALGQLGPVRAVDQGDMGEGRTQPAHRRKDLDLTRGVGQVVVATDNMGNAHIMIIDHNRMHIGWCAVRTQNDQVVQRRRFPAHRPLHGVLDDDRLIQRPTEAHRVGLGQVIDAGLAVAPGGDEAAPLGLGLIAQGRGLVGRQEVAIGVTRRQQLVDHLAVTVGASELEDRLFVAEQFEPGQAVEDGLHRLIRRTLAVGVLDTDQEFAAAPLGVQP
uniref:PE-PGRS family protein n=1 Tax=Parastrongyloides trichosuri TaxID=131310 RepID=A0A0N5A035_PARTI